MIRPYEEMDTESVVDVWYQASLLCPSALDHQRIAFWVRQFAELLEMPELWHEVEKLLHDSC